MTLNFERALSGVLSTTRHYARPSLDIVRRMLIDFSNGLKGIFGTRSLKTTDAQHGWLWPVADFTGEVRAKQV